MPIGSTPSLSTADGTSPRLRRNRSNHCSRFSPFHRIRSASCARQDVAGRRLVVVDLGARLGQRFDVRRVAGDVARHVGDHGEGGDDLQPLLPPAPGRGEGEREQASAAGGSWRLARGFGLSGHIAGAGALSMQMKIVRKNRFASARRGAAMLRRMGALQKPVDYEAVLRDAGLRITKPRRIILEILHGTEGHPDAAQIFERAVAMDSRISLATVYRTMKALEESRRDPAPRLRRRPGALRAGAGGAPRPPDRPRHRRGDRVRLRPDRGAAGGDRGAARLRDRPPPARALRPQDQGAGLTPRAARPQRRGDSPMQRERQPHRHAVDRA